VTSAVSGAMIVRPTVTASISGTATVCLNDAAPSITLTNPLPFNISITYNINGGTNQVVNVSANSTATISQSTSVAGTFIYNLVSAAYRTAPLCTELLSGSATIIVNPYNAIQLSSAAGTDNQTVCINNAITNITYTTIGATGATISGLPAGLNGNFASGTFTISGTPTVSGSFNYTITMTGGCTGGTNTISGTVNINPNNTIALSSVVGTDNQTLCINTAITNITYATTGATGATVTGLPPSVTGSWSAGVFTISGTPTAYNTYNYTITMTGGCTGGTNTISGTIIVNQATIITAQNTGSQTVCINNSFAPMTVTAEGVGLTYQWYSNTTASTTGGTPISGATTASYTPASTTAGITYYYVVVTGTCGIVTSVISGPMTVNPNNTVGTPSSSPTLCINTPITPNITIATTGATGIGTFSGLPGGVTATWSANTITIQGTPNTSGTFNYTIPLI
jgi:hypothetical protein